MVSRNEYRSGKGRNPKKKRDYRSKSAFGNKKRSPSKGKKTKSLTKSSRRSPAIDRPQRKQRREKPNNVVAFPHQPQSPKPEQIHPPRSGIELSFMLVVRLMILAVGTGAIAGTILSFINPEKYVSQPSPPATEITKPVAESPPSPPPPPVLPLDQEAIPLKQTLQRLGSEQSQLNPGAFIVDLDSGEYVSLQGEKAFSAASMIKVPILIAFFHAWDKGKLKLDERLTMTEEVKAGGSGNMQYEAVGTEYLALETAAKMIIISDNTATNMIIKRLGGKEALNQLFAEWGLEHTRLRNPLPDLEGTNTTSAKELVELLAKLNQGKLVSARSRDQIFRIMRETKTRTLLPQGLGEGASIAHKTGDIGSLVGDVGIIDRPSGKRYLAAIMVERPHNDRAANELIRQFSRETYQYFQNREQNSFID